MFSVRAAIAELARTFAQVAGPLSVKVVGAGVTVPAVMDALLTRWSHA
jgi:hypothetical protein